MPETNTEIAPRFLVSAVEPRQFPTEPVGQNGELEIAFLGRSNVGKSSLLNALVRRPGLAFISSRPGCTQAVNFYCVETELRFVDLPGYGFAKVPPVEKEKWRKLIEAYLLNRRNLRLCFLLLDARRGWMDMDLELKSWLEFHNRRYMVIVTKFDKLKSKNQQIVELARIQKQAPDQELVPFSAVDGRGVREIWQIISKIRNKK
jgi:GTP-binding protein